MHLTTSSALWSRRCLVPVLWELMHPLRAEGSASVPAVVCAFCATSLVETVSIPLSYSVTRIIFQHFFPVSSSVLASDCPKPTLTAYLLPPDTFSPSSLMTVNASLSTGT